MAFYRRNQIEFRAQKFKNFMRENDYGLEDWVKEALAEEKQWQVRENAGMFPFHEYPKSVDGFTLTHSDDGYILYAPAYFEENFHLVPPPKKESLMYRLDELLWPDCAVCRSARAWVLIANAATNVGVMVGVYYLIKTISGLS